MDGVEVVGGAARLDRSPIIVLSARDEQADEGRRAGRWRRRLRDQALRHGRAARPVARRPARAGRPGADGRGRDRRLHLDLAAKRVTRRRRGPPHADRVAPARGPGPAPRPPGHPARAAAGGVGAGVLEETNYLRVYLANLRRKLEPDPSRPRYLITEPGLGYRFDV